MKPLYIFFAVDFLLFILLTYLAIRTLKKEKKLSVAMDYYTTKSSSGSIQHEELVDTIYFEQDYSKDLKLHNALQKDEDYYRKEVAKILAEELIKNKAVDILFIQGIHKDTIKGKIKYVCKI
jgi:hypothetical protein